jgi:hypothetical protein
MEVAISKTNITEIEQRLETAKASLAASHFLHAQLTSQPGAPFYDSNTRAAMACPLLQSNGYIIPFKSIITQWFSSASPSDGYVHRNYICPVMQQPTNIASLAIQDKIRHVAQHTGLNIESPLNFSYMSDDGQWIEFSFHDQLNILAKLCTVQNMQISNCTELIVIHHNTMAFEINATITPVGFQSVFLFSRRPLTPRPTGRGDPRQMYCGETQYSKQTRRENDHIPELRRLESARDSPRRLNEQPRIELEPSDVEERTYADHSDFHVDPRGSTHGANGVHSHPNYPSVGMNLENRVRHKHGKLDGISSIRTRERTYP